VRQCATVLTIAFSRKAQTDLPAIFAALNPNPAFPREHG
jgi:hypothetical protein